MRFLTRGVTGVFLAALTIGLLAFGGGLMLAALGERGAREGGGRPSAERVLAVRTVVVEPEAIAPVLEAFGELRARRTLEIRAPVAGRIEALAPSFEEGGRVEAGERLVAIDPAPARAALERARAEASEAEAERREAERALALAREEVEAARAQAALQARALERARSLAGRGVGSEAAIEAAELAAAGAEQAVLARRQAQATAEARLDGADARIARAAIDVEEAERDLADTEIRAAFDGVLSEVATLEGGLAGLNERLATLVDPDRLEVEFRVSAAERARLAGEGGALIGAPVEVSLGASRLDRTAQGAIAREGAAVGEGRSGRMLYARLEEAAWLRPGDFVRVRVEEPPLEAVARLPASALGSDGAVLVLGAEDRLEAAPATLMRRQGDEVLVRAPDLAGREVVAERSPLLGPGIKVRPVRAPGADEGRAGAGDGSAAGRGGGGEGDRAAMGPDAAGPASGDGDDRRATPGTEAAAIGDGGADADVPAEADSPATDDPLATADARVTADPLTTADAPATVGAPTAAGAPANAGAAIALSPERRAALRAAVEADASLPREAKARLLADLDRAEVPARTVERIEAGRGI